MWRVAGIAVAVFGLAAVVAIGTLAVRQDSDLERRTIGESVHGRPLEVFCAGVGDAVVLLVAGLHTGHEANAVELVRALVAAVEDGDLHVHERLRLCLLPNANPDGVARGIHTNANGVDLNRNWPADNWSRHAFHPATGAVSGGEEPLSEPETQALHDFIVDAEPLVVISWHCCAGLVDANDVSQAQQWGRLFADVAQLSYIRAWTEYEVTGGFIRALGEIGIPAMDVELTAADAVPVEPHLDAVEAVLSEVADSAGR